MVKVQPGQCLSSAPALLETRLTALSSSRHPGREAVPLSAQPRMPRLLERAASKPADFTAFDHAGVRSEEASVLRRNGHAAHARGGGRCAATRTYTPQRMAVPQAVHAPLLYILWLHLQGALLALTDGKLADMQAAAEVDGGVQQLNAAIESAQALGRRRGDT